MKRNALAALLAAAALLSGQAASAQMVEPQPAAELAIQAEFVQPIYRNCKNADLAIVLPENDSHKKADVEVFDQNNNSLMKCAFKLKDGFNYYELRNIDRLADGRYPVSISFGDTTYRRLLRIEHVPEVEAPEKAIEQRMLLFTPDKYIFKSASKNLKVLLTQAEPHEVWTSKRPEVLYSTFNGMYRAKDGSYIGNGYENTYSRWRLYGDPKHVFIVKADSPEGPFTEIDDSPEADPYCFEDIFTAASAMNCWTGVNANGDANIKFELYDPAKHGSYKLSDVKMLQNIEPSDFGCVKAGYRTYWTFVTTSTGATVFLSDKPVFRDVPDYKDDEFDDGFMTNDNFGNSWFSEDGKTLYLTRGQTVHRFAPYDVPYDLLPDCSRILTIYSTTDGINWNYVHSMTSSGPHDTPFTQQYGGTTVYHKPSGLYLSFIMDYDSDYQCVSVDLEYSHDGVNFYDFPDNETGFLGTKDWNKNYFCIYGLGMNVLRFGDKYSQSSYLSMGYPHCFAEPIFLHDSMSEVEDDDYEKVFKDRRMKEALPYFDEVGGWKGMVDQMRNAKCVAMNATYRADGWFYVNAEAKPVKFTTNEIVGGGMLNVNAAVAEDGYMTIELLKGNKVVDKAEISGDAIKIPAFEMPEGEYSLRVKMSNAKLYAMYIE